MTKSEQQQRLAKDKTHIAPPTHWESVTGAGELEAQTNGLCTVQHREHSHIEIY